MKQILIAILILVTGKLFSQSEKKICVYFDEKDEHLKIQTSKDTTRTSFAILKKGYETKAKRKNARRKYKSKPYRVPTFWVNYYTTKKYRTIDKKEIVRICPTMMTVKELRSKELYPIDLVFIKKETNKFKAWNTLLMARE